MSSRMDAFSSSYSSEQVSYLGQILIFSLLGKRQKSLKCFSFSNEGIVNIVRCSLFHNSHIASSSSFHMFKAYWIAAMSEMYRELRLGNAKKYNTSENDRMSLA